MKCWRYRRGRWHPEHQSRQSDDARTMQVDNTTDPYEVDFRSAECVILLMPKFAHGQAISQAACLRERGFEGELRMRGDIRAEQLQFLAQCGVDVVETEHDLTDRIEPVTSIYLNREVP